MSNSDLVLLMSPKWRKSAIALDGIGLSGANGNPYTFTHVLNASISKNRIVVLGVAQWAGADTLGAMLFNGVAGTRIVQMATAPAMVEIYYWLDNQLPAAPGSYTVSVAGAGIDSSAVSVSLTGVNQINPFASSGGASGNSAVATVALTDGKAVFATVTGLSTSAQVLNAPLLASVVAQGNARNNSGYVLAALTNPSAAMSGADLRWGIGAVALNKA